MEPDDSGIEDRKLDVELRRIELDAEMRRAELNEKQAARESDERNRTATNDLKRRELDVAAGTGLRFTAAQATVVAGIFALLGGALGAFIQAYFTGKSGIELERQRLETTLILNATKNEDTDVRIKQLKFLVDAGLIQDEKGKIVELIKNRDVPVTSPAPTQLSSVSVSGPTCPAEAHWTYSQTTGMLCHAGQQVAFGYSGYEDGKNNPYQQSVGGIGPIPQGDWTIKPPTNTRDHGPYVLGLEPDASTNAFGRKGFLIHGDSSVLPGTAAREAIVVPRPAREQIWNSADPHLHVVP